MWSTKSQGKPEILERCSHRLLKYNGGEQHTGLDYIPLCRSVYIMFIFQKDISRGADTHAAHTQRGKEVHNHSMSPSLS